MSRKHWEDIDQEEVALQPGLYEVEVTDSREVEGSKLIFMDLIVLRGPDKGSTTSVSLYCPEDGDKAVFFFKQKAKGFAPVVKAIAAKNLDEGEVIGALAAAIVGARFEASLGIQTKGAYAGRQELLESKPLDGAAAVAPAIVEENGSGQVDEVAELRRKLAEAEAAKADVPMEPAADGAEDDELPF